MLEIALLVFFFIARRPIISTYKKILKIVQKFGPHHFDPSPSPIFLRTFGKEIGKDCETACRRAKKKTSSAISNMSFVGFWTDFEEILDLLKEFWTDFEAILDRF